MAEAALGTVARFNLGLSPEIIAWHQIGTAGEANRTPGPHAETAMLGETGDAGEIANVFAEQLLDGYAKPNGRGRPGYQEVYLPPHLRCGKPSTLDKPVMVNGIPHVYANCRSIYDRANNCFRKDHVPSRMYLLEFVTPIPEDDWWCDKPRLMKYMEAAGRIFISRIAELPFAVGGHVIRRPRIGMEWRRDVVHQFQGAHIATQAAVHAADIDVETAEALFATNIRRALKGVVIQSAVMAAEVSLLNLKRRVQLPEYSSKVRTLVADSQTRGVLHTLLAWLEDSLASEDDEENRRRELDRTNSCYDKPPKAGPGYMAA
jgi:hypothetical protein